MANFFAKTQEKFKIKNSDLASQTGLSAAYVSEIRSGKSTPSFDGLLRWLDGADAIAPGSRQYFCELLAGRAIENAIDKMDDEAMAQVLLAIADKLQTTKQSSPQELISA